MAGECQLVARLLPLGERPSIQYDVSSCQRNFRCVSSIT